jgi:hypothetical protein
VRMGFLLPTWVSGLCEKPRGGFAVKTLPFVSPAWSKQGMTRAEIGNSALEKMRPTEFSYQRYGNLGSKAPYLLVRRNALFFLQNRRARRITKHREGNH